MDKFDRDALVIFIFLTVVYLVATYYATATAT